MEELHAVEELIVKSHGLLFAKVAVLYYVVEEGTTGAIFHDNIVESIGLDELEELGDMLMLHFLQYGEFSPYLVDLCSIFDVRFGNDLHGH
jgi:hypothetical protein